MALRLVLDGILRQRYAHFAGKLCGPFDILGNLERPKQRVCLGEAPGCYLLVFLGLRQGSQVQVSTGGFKWQGGPAKEPS
jgi:hypothetical protein